MALYDVDRTSDDRGNPNPNTHDTSFISTAPIINAPRQAHQTLSTSYNTDATTSPNTRLVFKNTMVITYDSNNLISSVYGYIPQIASYPVFIVAQPGYDVYTDVLGITKPAGL